MSVLQVWLIAGIPSLALGLLLFLGRSPLRAFFGYLSLAAGFAIVTSVDRASGAVFAGILALLYATGRGGRAEQAPSEPDTVPDVARDKDADGTQGPGPLAATPAEAQA